MRIFRHLSNGEMRSMYFDVSIPKESYTGMEVYFWNADGDKSMEITNLKIVAFDEK